VRSVLKRWRINFPTGKKPGILQRLLSVYFDHYWRLQTVWRNCRPVASCWKTSNVYSHAVTGGGGGGAVQRHGRLIPLTIQPSRIANIESSPVWDTSYLTELIYDLIIRGIFMRKLSRTGDNSICASRTCMAARRKYPTVPRSDYTIITVENQWSGGVTRLLRTWDLIRESTSGLFPGIWNWGV